MRRFILIVTLVYLGGMVISIMAQENTGLLGGDNTVFDTSETAFTNPLPLLSGTDMALFEEGDELFEQEWERRNGLGNVFNARSCESCHVEDGRGRPPQFVGETGTGLLIRLAINNANGSTSPDPIYGAQFQDDSVNRVNREGTVAITYTEITGAYADGMPYTLYQPNYNLVNLNYGAIHSLTTLSPRIGTQMIGLGMLEAIDDSTILALADPNDVNGDGISGRVNIVWDISAGEYVVGRFGWKASQPTLIQQAAAAFNGDIGLTTYLFPDDVCTDAQNGCQEGLNRRDNNPPPPNGPMNHGNNANRNRDNGGEIEVTTEELLAITFYTQTLAVPAQRNSDDPQVLAGQALFNRANCSSCHVSTLRTSTHDSILALNNLTIQPYTDLLLHDMGDGLADGQADGAASGSEWRTPPLWGLGLYEEVNGYAFYLHDGRARSIEEAILWHGGEAQSSRDAFINMSADQRAALRAFLRSL